MSEDFAIREGMEVYGGDQLLGRVAALRDDGFELNGLHYTQEMIGRVEDDRVYIGDSDAGDGRAMAAGGVQSAETSGAVAMMNDHTETGVTSGVETLTSREANAATTRTGELTEGELRVPVIEERLAIGTREVDLGAIEIRRTVTEEEQAVPITLTHDEVHVEQLDVAARPATGDDLFEEGTIRMRLRGEEAVVAKETVVTGEVVLDKETVTEERAVTGTVRRQRVEVEQHERDGDQGTMATVAGTEPDYRFGFAAGQDARYAGREWAHVEPEFQRDYDARGVTRARWAELRGDIQAGWDKARGREIDGGR